jgi:enoyl-CoA hydratase/carnithine racemase
LIEFDRGGDVRSLRLRDSDNRFDRSTVDAINDAFDQVAATNGPAALVTVGAGMFFSNEFDLDWMGAERGDDQTFLFAPAHDYRLMCHDRGGLLTATAPAEQLLEEAVTLAGRHAAKDPRVIGAHKQLLYGRTGR